MTASVGRPPVAARPSIETASFAIHDVRFRVDSELPAAIEAVVTAYGAFRMPDDALPAPALHLALHVVDSQHRLTDHQGRVHGVPDAPSAVLGLLDRVVMLVLDELAVRGIVGTHAGVVAVDGRAVLLAGRSGRGKSTLTLGLVRRGAGFLTDELALVTPEGTVLPYPRALHVRSSTLDLLPELDFLLDRPRHDLGGGSEWSVTVDDLERAFGTRIEPATPLAAIVLLDADPDPARGPSLERVPAAVAAMELLRGTPAATRDFAGTMARLGAITSTIPTARLRAGELDHTAATVIDWLRSWA